MNKKQRDLVIAGVLVLFFVGLLAKNVIFNKKLRPAETPAPASSAQAPGGLSLSDELVVVTNMKVNDQQREVQEKIWEKDWGRDAFVPQENLFSIVRAVNLTLNGVLWDLKEPKAIVNEQTLLVGETIYGYTVVEIKPRSVVLRTGEKSIELSVFRPAGADIGAS